MNAPYSLTVVTVTYGDRWHLLEKTLEGCIAQGVKEVIVVDNASATPIESLVSSFAKDVDVIRIAHNSGSAIGFKIGIERALQKGCEYIMLLDDDNVPAPGSLSKLMHALADSKREFQGPVAVLGNRTHVQNDSADEFASKKVTLRPASFMGFHFVDIPFKLCKRIRTWTSIPPKRTLPNLVPVNVCTYGGLLFHRSTIEAVGLPREDFVLYVDDYELTHRITSTGGTINLVTDAKIFDLDVQWNAGARFTNTFKAWLLGDGDMRAYYTARNICYFEKYLQRHSETVRQMNKVLYMCILLYFAWSLNRHDRLALLRKAMTDGESGKMGVCREYPL